VRPQDIKTTALFTVEGELDDISGSGQTKAAHDLCSGIVRKEQRHLEAKGAGHYGIFSGRRWREVVYPQVRAFILEHEKPHRAGSELGDVTPDDDLRAAPAATPRNKPAARRPAASKPAPEATAPAVATRWVTVTPEAAPDAPAAAPAPAKSAARSRRPA
jgi:poly(3-hydroxybutyrate) depolymerase